MNLEKIGQLAVELHVATLARKGAKYDLKDKYQEFAEANGLAVPFGHIMIEQGHKLYPEMQKYADNEVKGYARAKLTEYNLKRKLDRAVRRYTAGGAQ